jgi:hypothetical protein
MIYSLALFFKHWLLSIKFFQQNRYEHKLLHYPMKNCNEPTTIFPQRQFLNREDMSLGGP